VQEIEDSNDENLINNIRSLVTDIKNSISDKGISK
jgi:hypothetical protein